MCHQFEMLPAAAVEVVARTIEQSLNAGADFAVSELELPSEDVPSMAFPGTKASVITAASGGGNALETPLMTWGFTVDWQDKPLFNTRLDTALRPDSLWNNALQERRCVVPVRAFFESHRTETVRSPKTRKMVKRRYRFFTPEEALFFLAGIYQDGCFSVVTVEPNDCVGAVHDRMPLILLPEEVASWLYGDRDCIVSLSSRASFALKSAAVEEAGTSPSVDPRQMSLF